MVPVDGTGLLPLIFFLPPSLWKSSDDSYKCVGVLGILGRFNTEEETKKTEQK
jgi:hypothetical protein